MILVTSSGEQPKMVADMALEFLGAPAQHRHSRAQHIELALHQQGQQRKGRPFLLLHGLGECSTSVPHDVGVSR